MKKKFYIVYRTDNLVNGKYYHGCHQTYDLDDSYLGSGTAFSRAVTKYGKEAFERTILGFYDSRELMLDAEKEAVNHTDPMSYNLAPGGSHTGDQSETTRGRIRKSLKGRKLSPDHCKKVSDALKGRKLSLKTRKKIGDSIRGSIHSPETRNKISATKRGKIVTEETRNKISATKRGIPRSAETKDKLRTASLAYWERKRNEKLRDSLPDQTGSFHFSYGAELGDDFLTMDTSLKSHLDDNATYKAPPPVPMKLARGAIT